MSVRVNVLYTPGTNCQFETSRAFVAAGARAELVFLEDLLRGRSRLSDADIVCLPGGFSFGDHVGAGNVAAQFLKASLADQFAECRERLMLCICNGFQIAARAGVFGELTLRINANGTFYDEPRQPHVVASDNSSPWLAGLGGETLTFPCAHGEGRLELGSREGWKPALAYPGGRNPDGSADDIAGVTSPDGLALGLMDHPERAQADPQVLELFRNGVRAASI